MHIVVAGGTGLIGSALIARLVAAKHTVTVLSRDPARMNNVDDKNIQCVEWDGKNLGDWASAIDGADAVVNLAGQSIAGKRWNSAQKQYLIDSRINATRAIVQAIANAKHKPSVLISGSAVGFYGDVPEGELDESSAPGKDFLAQLCVQWEAEARNAEKYGVRVVMIRTGLVLAARGGALGKLLLPFKLFAGGPLGSGAQWWPWIHIDDEIGMMMFAIEHAEISGAINACAPSPERMKNVAKVLGDVLHRPSFMPAPAFALRLLLGEMADVMLLAGQRAVPRKMLKAGYQFKFTSLKDALVNLVG